MRRWGCWGVLAAALVAATGARGAETMTGFIDRAFVDESGEHKYVLFVPQDYTPEKRWPVILFLHGAGERGTDNRKQVSVGLGPAVRKDPSRFPALVIFPQCEGVKTAPIKAWGPTSPDGVRALAILEAVEKEYSTDPDRVYLTGLSMGGFGTWAHAIADPRRWAAIVPICGGSQPSEAAKLAHMPIWCFHSADDPVVPVKLSRGMVEAVKSAGGRPKYTEYADAGHRSWDPAYDEPELWTWLFQQRRGSE